MAETYATLFDKLFARVDRLSDDPNVCWPWLGPTIQRAGYEHMGYGRMWWKGKRLLTHRVAFDECVDDIPEGMHVLHTCDNPQCCRPSHLFLGTQQDNVDDMMIKGRNNYGHLVGEAHGNTLLSETEVRKIFRLAWNGELSQREIAEGVGISREAVRDIKSGRSWAHLNLRQWRTPQIMDISL